MKKSEQTKQKLIEKAINVVANKGYSASSTKEIAEKAGVSEATLFKYYKNKDNLLKEIVIKTLNDLYTYSINKSIPELFEKDTDRDAKDLIEDLLLNRLDLFQKNFQAIQVIIQEMMINNEIKELFRNKVWAQMEDLSTQIFNKAKTEKQIKDIDNYFLRKALFGILFFSITFEPLLDEKQSESYNNQEQAKMITKILFDGIKN